MKKYYSRKIFITAGCLLLSAIIIFAINSCKKDNAKATDNADQLAAINSAKIWYQSTYPANSTTSNVVASNGSNTDLSQFVKPHWESANTYDRSGSHVVELPIDSVHQINITSIPGKAGVYNSHSLSRSSILILNNNGVYNAYVMTVIADSAYINNDYAKLAHNTYQKRDKDFSGVLLYSTPKGKLLNGYRYKNGKITAPLPVGSATSVRNGLAVQSVGGGLKTMDTGCIDWYYDYYIDGSYSFSIYAGTTCPPDVSGPDEQSLQPDPGSGGDPTFPAPPGGGGGGNGSSTTALLIKDDSLKKHFPCSVKLIIDSLEKIPAYATLISGFNTPVKPNLTFRDSSMDWNKSGPNGSLTFMYGLTTRDTTKSAASSVITLNTSMLQNSSQLLIAGVTIHETIHAVINYNIVYAGYGLDDGNSWMDALNSWYLIQGLPANFRDHYEMMDYYFSQTTALLAQWDNNQHTAKEYEMTMLIGLNNPGVNPGNDPNYATEVTLLQTEYDSLKTKYGISESDLNTFKNANNYASASAKLPTSGCN